MQHVATIVSDVGVVEARVVPPFGSVDLGDHRAEHVVDVAARSIRHVVRHVSSDPTSTRASDRA